MSDSDADAVAEADDVTETLPVTVLVAVFDTLAVGVTDGDRLILAVDDVVMEGVRDGEPLVEMVAVADTDFDCVADGNDEGV